MNEWISRYSLLPWLDRECHTLRSEDLQAAQKARVDGTHDWCVHRLHGRSGYGLLNIYRSMVEFLIVHLLIIELLSVILNFWHHFFSYLSIHSHTRPVHAAKLRSPQCVFSLWRAAGKTRSGMDRCGMSDLERSECPLTGDVPVREVRQCYHQPWLKWCLFIEAD